MDEFGSAGPPRAPAAAGRPSIASCFVRRRHTPSRAEDESHQCARRVYVGSPPNDNTGRRVRQPTDVGRRTQLSPNGTGHHASRIILPAAPRASCRSATTRNRVTFGGLRRPDSGQLQIGTSTRTGGRTFPRFAAIRASWRRLKDRWRSRQTKAARCCSSTADASGTDQRGSPARPRHDACVRADGRSYPPKTVLIRLLAPADMVISNFHIEFDKNGVFRPGEKITGQVIMDVWSRTEICHVEFSLLGKGTVRIFQNRFTFIERPKHETYLNKQILLISPPGGATSLILNPGRYVSDFSYCLPDSLPPSVHQFDMGNGYVFDISYMAQANVCDTVGTRYIQPLTENSVKVVKSVKHSFQVLPPNDWRTLPGARESVQYSEQLLLFCSCTSTPTKVDISLDRGVYPVGDVIKARIAVTNPAGKQSVKSIRASLEQRMTYKDDLIQKFRKILVSAEDNVRYNPFSEIRSGFSMPIPTTIVPSYLPHCTILDVLYAVKVTVRFKGYRGKLTVSLPLLIAPAGHDNKHQTALSGLPRCYPHSAGRSSSDEGFGTLRASSHDAERPSTPPSGYQTAAPRAPNAQDQITTKYKTGLKCCPCCLLFCRFGIYNEDED